MAPTRKSRSVNKRFSSEISPDKDVGNSSKSKQRKKKLSDKLGSQWSKGELERFYEAYRKCGKDWKKVATVVRNRSVEMVEALYNMNRAYLSLPEGTASMVGLIAMMTDHYNVLGGSDSERESNDASGILQKPQKCKRAKVQHSNTKEDIFLSQSMASNDGCLSFLKRAQSYGNQPRATGKRTPRYPVSHSFKKDDRGNHNPPNKKARKSELDTNDDHVAHVAASALAERMQRGGSPKVSQTPCRSTELNKFSPVESWKRSIPQPGEAHSKLCDASIYEDWIEGAKGNRRREKGAYVKDTSSLMDIEGVGTVEVLQKGKKFYGKKVKVEEVGNNHSDDGGEACSGTEEGHRGNYLKGKVDIEVSNVKTGQCSPQVQRKRNNKLYFGDESSALDALQALADLSTLMLPASTVESESSAQLKEERTLPDMDEKSSAPEATSTSHHRRKIKNLGTKEKALRTVAGDGGGTTSRKSKIGKHSSNDAKVFPEVKQQPQSTSISWKRKRKSLVSKELSKEENKSVVKGKRTGQISDEAKHWKSVKVSQDSSNSDEKKEGSDLAVSTAQVSAVRPVGCRSRHKMALKRILISKEVKPSENIMKNRPNKDSLSQEVRALSVKEKLSCCLSSPLACRWCTFEWFYSAIDYPWFAKREFVDYLNHVGLGHIPRLTRVEWGVIRSSLGKPRRFSERFLNEEREKLKQYLESVRKHYSELRTGVREGLPTDLARPLSVGKRVVAIHPQTREVHDGKVLTVDHDKCSVLFDHTELGVEFVMDIDCMPLNSLDYMPEALRRENFAVDKCSLMCKEPPLNRHPNFCGSMIFHSSGQLESPLDINRASLQAKTPATRIVYTQQTAYNQPCITAPNQAREADIHALSVLNHTLDVKVDINRASLQAKAPATRIVCTQQTAYNQPCITVPNQASEADIHSLSVLNRTLDEKASSALLNLGQHNAYQGNLLPARPKSSINSTFLGCLTSSIDSSFASQESRSEIYEIVKGSRLKAHAMVDAAIKVLSSMKEGEDAFIMIGEALDSVDKQQLASDSRVSVIRSQEQVNSSLGHFKSQDSSDKIEAQIPSELITSCVATLLMVQMCTERQYPPADVAQIIDSGVTGLHPYCPQNLPIYREIQMCMGRIKTQMLALIPT